MRILFDMTKNLLYFALEKSIMLMPPLAVRLVNK